MSATVVASPPGNSRTPRFSVVSAVYNVSKYLPEFIASIEAQRFDLDDLEVIAVDDGSTDDSLQLLCDWASRRPDLVTVITKPNGGQGSARNVGIAHARGTWVTMPDPDDLLDPDYFARVAHFLDRHPEAVMIGTNRLYLREDSGRVEDTHPLRKLFAPGDQLVDLRRFPEYFHGSAPASFFRTDLLRLHEVAFDPRIRPNFEDGHFCSQYLLAVGEPLVGFVGSARYLYRTRADGSSTLQNSLLDPRRFIDVPRYGYLGILKQGAESNGGRPPEWLQNFVLYELSFYFSSDQAFARPTAAIGEVGAAFISTLSEIVELLEPHVIKAFSVRPLNSIWRDIMLHGLHGTPWHTPYVIASKLDKAANMIRLVYRFVGEPPTERIEVHGRPFTVEHGKIRDLRYFGSALMHERIMWVPLSGTIRVLLDGVPVPIRREWEGAQAITFRPANIVRWFEPARPARRRSPLTLSDRLLRAWASSPLNRRFAGAWVLMDRVDDANDSGEHLFRWLREHRPDINAWFVLEEGTPDWERLRSSEFADRLVAYGSPTWERLMLRAAYVISSHADEAIVRPTRIARFGKPRWRRIFLQHGVTKDDLSGWLNPKDFDLFVTSTPAEQEAVAGDHSAYTYTSREARLVGLPRFDRIYEALQRVPDEERNIILVSPTWRQWLKVRVESALHIRRVVDDFLDSEYAQQWLRFLGDERLHVLAREHGLRICFMPHPNIEPALPSIPLPPGVEAITFTGTDVAELVARTAVMVTDYSSTAFNAAYANRPVVYYQFDAELVIGRGAQGAKWGYFDYRRDGFGPVAHELDDAIAAVASIVEHGCRASPEYQARMDAAFVLRDGRCCERVTAAIESIPPHPTERGVIWRAAARLTRQEQVRKLISARSGRWVYERARSALQWAR